MDDAITISDDESEDEANLPSREECEKRCQDFSSVTSRDSAYAMMMLQRVHWNLDEALDLHFSKSSTHSTRNNSTRDNIPHLDPATHIDPEPNRVRLLSWNIDGLDDKNIQARTAAVCDVINRDKPHLVFLQEVTPLTQPQLETALPTYQLISASNHNYYTAALLDITHTTLAKHEIIPFPQSCMGRNLLDIMCTVKGVAVRAMTSHLESTREYKDERLRQLERGFWEMRKTPDDIVAIFGGDMNLRDSELYERGGLPAGIQDVWEVTGARPIARYTWDMTCNNNIEVASKWKARTRFDRLYIKSRVSPGVTLKPVYFELVGLEKVKNLQRFPSDHWGMLAHFDKVTV